MNLLLAIRQFVIILSLSILAGVGDLAFAGPPEGIYWRMSKDAAILENEGEHIATYEDTFKISTKKLSEKDTLLDFEKNLSEIAQKNQEIHIYLNSHGCVGAICHGDNQIKYEEILSSIQKVTNRASSHEGKNKFKVNLICDACFSGSLIHKAVLEDYSFELNILSATKANELSYGGVVGYQLSQAKDFLSKMPENLKDQFCPKCSEFQKIGKLIQLLEFSNYIKPQVYSSNKIGINRPTFTELNALMQYSFLGKDNYLRIKIMDIIHSQWPYFSNKERELILSFLKNIMSTEWFDKKIVSQYFHGLYSKNPEEMIEAYSRSDFNRVFKPHYFQGINYSWKSRIEKDMLENGGGNEIKIFSEEDVLKQRTSQIDVIIKEKPDLAREMNIDRMVYEKIIKDHRFKFIREHADKFPPEFGEWILRKMTFEIKASPSIDLNLKLLNNLVLLRKNTEELNKGSFAEQMKNFKKEIMLRMLSQKSYEKMTILEIADVLKNKSDDESLYMVASEIFCPSLAS